MRFLAEADRICSECSDIFHFGAENMCTRILVAFGLAGMLAATSAFAAGQPQPKSPVQKSPAQAVPIYTPPPQEQLIYNNTAELLKQVAALQSSIKALQTSVATLENAQSQQTAQLKDMARRLYGVCVMQQTVFGFHIGGTVDAYGDFPMCTWAGFNTLISGGTAGFFNSNPTNFDTPFGGQ
jgi:hypothetical protein